MSTTTAVKHDATIPAATAVTGADATPFDDMTTGRTVVGIKTIVVYAQAVVTGIQVGYVLADGSIHEAPVRGTADGTRVVVTLAPNEALIGIAARSTAAGLDSLSFTVTDQSGKATVIGPFAKAASVSSTDLHDIVLGGTGDQGFSFFGKRAVALCGKLKGGRPVELGVYTLPLVDIGNGVSATSVLATDFKPQTSGQEKVAQFSNYRTILTVPWGTKSVDLWSEDQLAVTIANRAYTLDPVKKVTVTPNALGKVVIDIQAPTVSVPALKVKTPQMSGPWQWYSIHPDVPAHAKIAALGPDALHKHRAELDIDRKYSQVDCAHVQAALVNVAKAAGPTQGNLRHERQVRPMDHPNWLLDFRGGGPQFKPLSDEEVKAVHAALPKTAPPATAQSWGSFTHWISHATHVVVSSVEKGATGAAKEVAQETTVIGKGVLTNAEKAAADAKKAGVDAAKTATKVAIDVGHGNLEAAGKDLVKGGLTLGLDVAATSLQIFITVVTAEGQALGFVLDHCGKYGALVDGILGAIALKVEEVVEFLCDARDWESFLDMQKAIVAQVEASAASIIAIPPATMTTTIDAIFDAIKSSADTGIASAIKRLGGVTSDGKIMLPNDLAKAAHTVETAAGKAAGDALQLTELAVEKLEWLLSKVLDNLPGMKGLDGVLTDVPPELAALPAKLEACIAPVAGDIDSALAESFQDLMATGKNVTRAPELFVCAVLQLVEKTLDAGLDVAKAIINLLVEAMGAILKLALKAVSASIDIPFVSALYTYLTHEKLSIVSLGSLLVAVPATLTHVAMYGKPPSFTPQLAQSNSAEDYQRAAALISACGQMAGAIAVGLLDTEVLVDASWRTGSPSVATEGPRFLERLSWVGSVVAQAFGSDYTAGELTPALPLNGIWWLGWCPVVADGLTLWLGKPRRRFVRSLDRGPVGSLLLGAVLITINATVISSTGEPDAASKVRDAGRLLGPAADSAQAAVLSYKAVRGGSIPLDVAEGFAGWYMVAGLAGGVLDAVSRFEAAG